MAVNIPLVSTDRSFRAQSRRIAAGSRKDWSVIARRLAVLGCQRVILYPVALGSSLRVTAKIKRAGSEEDDRIRARGPP